jgi:subtilisin family serine protease
MERAAFQQFYDDGVLLVAAAGNHGSSQDSWPASYESVISVAGTPR